MLLLLYNYVCLRGRWRCGWRRGCRRIRGQIVDGRVAGRDIACATVPATIRVVDVIIVVDARVGGLAVGVVVYDVLLLLVLLLLLMLQVVFFILGGGGRGQCGKRLVLWRTCLERFLFELLKLFFYIDFRFLFKYLK